MRDVTIGGVEYKIHASVITLSIYKKTFHDDLLAQIVKMQAASKGEGQIDVSAIGFFDLIQMAWAMAKTANPKLDDFEPWLESVADADVDITVIVKPVVAEIMRAFFRGGTQGEAATKEATTTE